MIPLPPRCVARVLSLALSGISHLHHPPPLTPYLATYSSVVLLPLSYLLTYIVHLAHL